MTKKLSGPVLGRFPLNQSSNERNFIKEADRFLELVQSAKRILISSTLTSDGDSIGAQLGIYHLIRKLLGSQSPEIWMIDESPVPDRYRFLDSADQIMSWAEWKSRNLDLAFDLGIVLDGGIERTGSVRDLFEKIPNNILVDHHQVGSRLKYESTLLDLDSSSTCEIVYLLYEIFGVPLDREVAAILYVGIIFDTGFFKHSLTKPRTHYVASELIATGINFSEIADRAILERTWSGQLLLQKLLNNMERSSCGRVIHSSWSQKELEEIQFKDGDQEGMINQMYYTDTAQVVALFVEQSSQQVKISFRSKGAVNVAEFARQLHPEGGGHVRAAGCLVSGSLHEVRQQVVQKLLKSLA